MYVVRQHQRLDATANAAEGQCAHDRQFGTTTGGAVTDRRVKGDGDDETLRHGSGDSTQHPLLL
jgi:hypothetical protein